MSYFEIETQLLTFRKDILPYELAYHLIFPNRNGNQKVERGEWGVHCVTICTGKLFEITKALPGRNKLLPLHRSEECSRNFESTSIVMWLRAFKANK